MRYCGYDKADGILADLGVSSHEFDEADRGFSFRFDAELDMRMNQRNKLKATDVLNSYSEEELTRVFRNYGEVDNVKRLVGLIVKARAENEINRSEEFLQVIDPCVPKQKEKKYLAQVYQSICIQSRPRHESPVRRYRLTDFPFAPYTARIPSRPIRGRPICGCGLPPAAVRIPGRSSAGGPLISPLRS